MRFISSNLINPKQRTLVFKQKKLKFEVQDLNFQIIKIEKQNSDLQAIHLHSKNNLSTIKKLFCEMKNFCVSRKKQYDSVIEVKSKLNGKDEQQILQLNFMIENLKAERAMGDIELENFERQWEELEGQVEKLLYEVESLKNTNKLKLRTFFKIFELVKVSSMEELLKMLEQQSRQESTLARRVNK